MMAIDLGSMVLKARHVQGAADLASLAAARDLPRAPAAALSTAQANLGSDITVVTTTGTYVGDAAIPVGQRFTVGGSNINAAKVRITGKAPLFFARIIGYHDVTITREAIAALPGAKPSAMFSIGSRLLSLNRGVLNMILGGLLGSSVNLNVMDYNTLVGTKVNLLEFFDALAVKLNVEAGDYDALLAHDVTTGQVLDVLRLIADDDERAVLGAITGSRLSVPIKVGDLLGVNADAKDGLRRALNLDVAALDLLIASLETANGNRQLALHGDINAILADVTVMVAIGERPNQSSWLTVSSGGTPVLTTAQTRVFVKAETKNLVPQLLHVDLQAFAEVASAEAKISSIQCGANRSVDVQARPGVARVTIGRVTNPGDLKDFTRKINTEQLTLAEVLLIPIKLYANVESKDRNWQTLRFNQSEITEQSPKTVRSQELVGSLLNNLTKDIKLSIGGLELGWVVNLLGPLLTPIGYLVDMIINPLLRILGIGLGEADVQVLGINCPGGVGGIPYLVG